MLELGKYYYYLQTLLQSKVIKGDWKSNCSAKNIKVSNIFCLLFGLLFYIIIKNADLYGIIEMATLSNIESM